MLKYDWLPTESAEKQFPMRIVDGDFYFKNGGSIYIPDGRVIENGLGELGSIHIVGDDFKPIPDKLAITWFSYIENKFYSGEFELPYDKIKQLFDEGLKSPASGKHITYGLIMVGLGLNGEVSVYLNGDGVVLEVAHFQAKETDVDWTRLTDNTALTREDYVERVLSHRLSHDQILQSKKQAANNDPWEGYKIKYTWDLEITGNSKPESIWLKTVNGEYEYIDYLNGKLDREKLRSVPKTISVCWESPSGTRYNAKILFNNEEMLKAFEKLYKSNPKDKLSFQVEIDAISNNVKTHLVNSKYSIELKDITIDVGRFAKKVIK
jgi:arsenate reductase-like glutaredoxin family protein